MQDNNSCRQMPNRHGRQVSITVDCDRDFKLTQFGRATLTDRYLLPGEDYQGLFARVAGWFADNDDHAQRLYDYISNLWFMPSTPILSNGGTDRGMPISCFLNSVEDSLEGIFSTENETGWLAARGGGIGTDWSKVRSLGEKVGMNGKTSGVVPFLKVQDSRTLAISQGSLRRGSSAAYMNIDHPEIEAFIDIRRPTGGDADRRCMNIHNGVTITDAFMHAVERDGNFDLKSPKTGEVLKTVKARDLWVKLLQARIETGEPYMLFIDRVNDAMPVDQKSLGMCVSQSNLCSEITLPTGRDHLGNMRTAVCCLSSINLEKWEEYSLDRDVLDQFIRDILIFLDNVLEDFIDRTRGMPGFERARYSAKRERAIGLGVMGFHSLLQQQGIPFESLGAKLWNKRIFKTLKKIADQVNEEVGKERGVYEDMLDAKIDDLTPKRWSNMFAVAPTASISIIAGNASPGIEPFNGNSFTQKTLSGSFSVKNRYVKSMLASYGRDNDDTWSSITVNDGSVQHLDFITDEEKAIFKTAFELDQKWIVEHAADRTPFICQAQSVNLFLPGDVHKGELHMLHYSAWKKGMKSLYYCRSTSVQKADVVSHVAGEMPQPRGEKHYVIQEVDECLSCQ